MGDCIFCKIVNGEIPTNMVYKDDVVAAFLDTSQVTKGHTLLVPKKHLKDITEYTEEDASQVFRRIPIIVQALLKTYPQIKGINIVNNNGEVAYQSVFHSHIHIIPRYSSDDGFKLVMAESPAGKYTDEDLAKIAKEISANVEA